MNKCILARIHKNCKAQCGQYRIQKEFMWVNIKWKIILICEESIPARNWTRDLLHPEQEDYLWQPEERVLGEATRWCSRGAEVAPTPTSTEILRPHRALIHVQMYKCCYVMSNNRTKIIKAVKQSAMPPQSVLEQRTKNEPGLRSKRHVGSSPRFDNSVVFRQEKEAIYPRLSFLICKMGIRADARIGCENSVRQWR